jgi:hypothetical protein
MYKDPFPYEIVEPDGTQHLPALPTEDDLVDDAHKAARVLDLSCMVKYIGEPIDVYIQGVKQPDARLSKVDRKDDLWFFETEENETK